MNGPGWLVAHGSWLPKSWLITNVQGTPKTKLKRINAYNELEKWYTFLEKYIHGSSGVMFVVTNGSSKLETASYASQLKKTNLTNHTGNLSHISQYTHQNRNVLISDMVGVLCDMRQVRWGFCEICLLYRCWVCGHVYKFTLQDKSVFSLLIAIHHVHVASILPEKVKKLGHQNPLRAKLKAIKSVQMNINFH